MIVITHGSGYAAALDLINAHEQVEILEVNPTPNFDGIITKTYDVTGQKVIDLGHQQVIEGADQYGASALAFTINNYSDVNIRVAQELKLRVPAVFHENPAIPSRQIGTKTWIEKHYGTEFSVRGFWDGEEFGMYAITGRWNKALAGDVGPSIAGAICTAFSVLPEGNPLQLQFDLLAEYIRGKKDSYRGPVYITVIDDGKTLWYSDISFGYRLPEEYALSALAPADKVYLGGWSTFGKGYSLALVLNAYQPFTKNVEEIDPNIFKLEAITSTGNGQVITTNWKLGYAVGYGHTFAEAYTEAEAAVAETFTGAGFRSDAGKRAKEWYYHVHKRIKG